MGGFTIVYTALGGMKAVIWTDFFQVIVLMGGAIFAIGFIITRRRRARVHHDGDRRSTRRSWSISASTSPTPTVWGFIILCCSTRC